MRLVIAAIGKLKDDGETVLVGRYRERIAAIGPSLGFQDIVIHETAESKKPNPGQRKEEEAQALLKGIGPAAALVALDERGAWVEEGKLRHHGSDDSTARIITTTTFSQNIVTLASHVASQ